MKRAPSSTPTNKTPELSSSSVRFSKKVEPTYSSMLMSNMDAEGKEAREERTNKAGTEALKDTYETKNQRVRKEATIKIGFLVPPSVIAPRTNPKPQPL